jgi:hypothetical protein
LAAAAFGASASLRAPLYGAAAVSLLVPASVNVTAWPV